MRGTALARVEGLRKGGDLTQARSAVQEAIAAVGVGAPNGWKVLAAMGRVELDAGDADQANKALQEALAVGPTPGRTRPTARSCSSTSAARGGASATSTGRSRSSNARRSCSAWRGAPTGGGARSRPAARRSTPSATGRARAARSGPRSTRRARTRPSGACITPWPAPTRRGWAAHRGRGLVRARARPAGTAWRARRRRKTTSSVRGALTEALSGPFGQSGNEIVDQDDEAELSRAVSRLEKDDLVKLVSLTGALNSAMAPEPLLELYLDRAITWLGAERGYVVVCRPMQGDAPKMADVLDFEYVLLDRRCEMTVPIGIPSLRSVSPGMIFARALQLCDRPGIESVWFMDHLYPPVLPQSAVVRGVDDCGGAGRGHRARPARPPGPRERLSPPGTAGQDGDHARPSERRPFEFGHRQRLLYARSSPLRLSAFRRPRAPPSARRSALGSWPAVR